MTYLLLSLNIDKTNGTMCSFLGRFNYLILVLRVATILFFGALFLFFFIVTPLIFNLDIETGEKVIRFFGSIVILCSSFLIIWNLTKDIIKQRFNIKIENDNFYLLNVLTGEKKFISVNSIRGYSTTDILYDNNIIFKEGKVHCLIIYVENINPIEFPKFLFRNFNDFKHAFESVDISYLGHEEFSKSLLGKRNYKYI